MVRKPHHRPAESVRRSGHVTIETVSILAMILVVGIGISIAMRLIYGQHWLTIYSWQISPLATMGDC